MRNLLFIALVISIPELLFSQVIYQDLSNQNIYEFIDELANLKIISIQGQVKPYSRIMIAEKLSDASAKREFLNKRQKKELDFYLKEYNLELNKDLGYFKTGKGLFRKTKNAGIPGNPPAFLYKDSLFTFSIRPVWGIQYYFNDGGTEYHRWGGAEAFGTIGKHFGFYSSLRDHHESLIMVEPEYFTQDEGAVWKKNDNGGGDYSEMRGGLTYSWKWGSVALTKDHFEWGENNNGSVILSGRTPSFPCLDLRMYPVKWFSYNFLTGWLASNVIDSSRSYAIPGGTRNIYFNKFISAAMLTFTPWKGFSISLGNSVVSCSEYYNPAFLSPLLFFTNFSYSGDSLQKQYYGQNSQLFFTVSSRQIRHLHLYASLFIDDLGTVVYEGGNKYNSWSGKAGFRLSDFPFSNLSFTGEYTWSDPNVYLCNVSTLTYASNNYNLGHYLGDNSSEIYLAVSYKPIRGLHAKVDYSFARHGDDQERKTMSEVIWETHKMTAEVKYEIVLNTYIYLQYVFSKSFGDQDFTPPQFRGHVNNLVAGFNIGF